MPKHVSNEKMLALQNLRKKKNTVIQKSGKSNSTVIVNKTDYLNKMEKLFETINLKNDRFISDNLKCNFDCDDLRTFKETVLCIFDKYALIKKRSI